MVRNRSERFVLASYWFVGEGLPQGDDTLHLLEEMRCFPLLLQRGIYESLAGPGSEKWNDLQKPCIQLVSGFFCLGIPKAARSQHPATWSFPNQC